MNLANLYQQLRNENLEKVLSESPQSILIYRLSLNMGQRDFAKKLGKSQATISEIERGLHKQLDSEIAKRWASILQDIEILQLSELQGQHRNIAKRGLFKGEYAKKMARKGAVKAAIRSNQLRTPTAQEKHIAELLEENKIPFDSQSAIKAGNQHFVADFLIPTKNNSKLLIEVKALKTIYSKRLHVIDLAYRSIKIKDKFPNYKTMAIIETNKLIPSQKKILTEDYDFVLINPTDRKIIGSIRRSFL